MQFMDMQIVLNYIHTYGLIVLFIIVFGEYSIPGIPTGIVMPAAGIVAGRAHEGLFLVMFISLIAGLAGSIALYAVGYYVGSPILNKIEKKFPKTKKPIERTQDILEKHGFIGIFICRLIPVVRTLVSVISGSIKMNCFKFMVFSIPGIFCWNLSGIVVGYFFGGTLLK